MVGGTAFVQTGVIGECNRDGNRHSRLLTGDALGFKLYTVDHGKGQVGCGATCDPAGAGTWHVCGAFWFGGRAQATACSDPAHSPKPRRSSGAGRARTCTGAPGP